MARGYGNGRNTTVVWQSSAGVRVTGKSDTRVTRGGGMGTQGSANVRDSHWGPECSTCLGFRRPLTSMTFARRGKPSRLWSPLP